MLERSPREGTGDWGSMLVDVAPSAVVSIELEDADGEVVRVFQHESGVWLHAQDGKLWTADPVRTRSGLRVICDAVTRGQAEDRIENGIRVTLGLVDGGSIGLTLDPVSVGGRTRILTDSGRGVLVDDRLGRLLTLGGVSAWRGNDLWPLLDARVRRVSTPQAEATRVGERWSMVEPVGVAARTEAILDWLGALASGRGVGGIRAEIEGAAAGAVRQWAAQESGGELTVEVTLRDGTVLGPRVFSNRGIPPLEPGSLVTRTAVGSDPTLIAAVEIGQQRAQRNEQGWSVPWGEALVEALSLREADEIALSSRPPGEALRLFGFGGLPLEDGVISRDPDTGDVGIWRGGVLWIYRGSRAEVFGSALNSG